MVSVCWSVIEEYGKFSLRWRTIGLNSYFFLKVFTSLWRLETCLHFQSKLSLLSQLDVARSNFSSCNGPVTHQIVLVTDKQMLKSFSGLSTSFHISLKFYLIVIVLLSAFAISNLKCVHDKKNMPMKMDISAPSTFLCTAMGVQYESANMEEFYRTHRILQVLFVCWFRSMRVWKKWWILCQLRVWMSFWDSDTLSVDHYGKALLRLICDPVSLLKSSVFSDSYVFCAILTVEGLQI